MHAVSHVGVDEKRMFGGLVVGVLVEDLGDLVDLQCLNSIFLLPV